MKKVHLIIQSVLFFAAPICVQGLAFADAPYRIADAQGTLDKHSINSVSSHPKSPVGDSLLIAQSETLTGVWNCNDGGVYFIRQIGNQVWWYGQSSDGGATWSNVFQGTITGSRITGSWADVPKGSIRGNGSMTLSIEGSNRLRKIGAGGSGFGGSLWSR